MTKNTQGLDQLSASMLQADGTEIIMHGDKNELAQAGKNTTLSATYCPDYLDAAQNRLPRVAFVTLGCAKNEVDTDRMRALVSQASYPVVEDTVEAEVVIVNTCSFLQVSTEEGITVALEILDQRHELNSDVILILAGCIPSRYKPEELKESLPEVHAFVPSEDEDNIVHYIEELTHTRGRISDPAVLRTIEAPYAYLKISEGCDRMCTFCAIPYIRGRYRSRSAEEILEEAEALLAGGVRELVVIGQDTGVWGEDFSEDHPCAGMDLADLLERLALRARPYDAWVRTLYLQPEGLSDKLLSTIAKHNELLPYFDIPIQHCSARILKAMNRSGSPQELAQSLDLLRRRLPGCILRTTVISGFPSETDEEAEELCDFLAEQSFDFAGVFMYSQEDGTAAARMRDQIPEEVKLERAQAVQETIELAGFTQTASHVGEIVEVLVDGVEELEDGSFEYIGRAWFQAPDTDGAIHLPGIDCAIGDKLRVRLVDSFCYELIGELVDEEQETGVE